MKKSRYGEEHLGFLSAGYEFAAFHPGDIDQSLLISCRADVRCRAMTGTDRSGMRIDGAMLAAMASPETLHSPGVLAALGAAMLFGAGTPPAKALLAGASPWFMAGLLYLGSGPGRLPSTPTPRPP